MLAASVVEYNFIVLQGRLFLVFKRYVVMYRMCEIVKNLLEAVFLRITDSINCLSKHFNLEHEHKLILSIP